MCRKCCKVMNGVNFILSHDQRQSGKIHSSLHLTSGKKNSIICRWKNVSATRHHLQGTCRAQKVRAHRLPYPVLTRPSLVPSHTRPSRFHFPGANSRINLTKVLLAVATARLSSIREDRPLPAAAAAVAAATDFPPSPPPPPLHQPPQAAAAAAAAPRRARPG